MITETTYGLSDLRKRCYNCKYLKIKSEDDLIGDCICTINKVKNRHRSILDRRCIYKESEKE
jgi:hypothetical protein